MRSWYFIKLPGGLTGALEVARLQQRILSEAREGDSDMPHRAAFVHHDTMFSSWAIYFSPESADLARRMRAEPCNKPARRGLNLIFGDPKCWDDFFPRSSKRLNYR